VRATLTGAAADLARIGIFLQAVTGGHDPAVLLADLRLARITITEMRREGAGIVLTLRLDDTDAVPN